MSGWFPELRVPSCRTRTHTKLPIHLLAHSAIVMMTYIRHIVMPDVTGCAPCLLPSTCVSSRCHAACLHLCVWLSFRLACLLPCCLSVWLCVLPGALNLGEQLSFVSSLVVQHITAFDARLYLLPLRKSIVGEAAPRMTQA